MQDGNTAQMIHTVPQLISFLSQGTTLVPGSVILTGAWETTKTDLELLDRVGHIHRYVCDNRRPTLSYLCSITLLSKAVGVSIVYLSTLVPHSVVPQLRVWLLYELDSLPWSAGTPAGVGYTRGVFLKNGDTVTIEIANLGRLRNVVAEEVASL